MGQGVPGTAGGEDLRLVFDTRSLLKLLFDEPGGDDVSFLVAESEAGRAEGFISAITLTELWYLIFRRDAGLAERSIQTVLGSLDLVPIEETISIQAGKYKVAKPIPIADALIAATAAAVHGTVVTDDKDFAGLGVDARNESALAKELGRRSRT